MSAVLALQRALSAGARVFVRDGRLVVQTDDQLPGDVLADLRTHRRRLVEILLTPSAEQPGLLPESSVVEPIDTSRPNDQTTKAGETAPFCTACGRRQHQVDYVCQEQPDPAYPIAPGWPGLAAAIAAILAAEDSKSMTDAA